MIPKGEQESIRQQEQSADFYLLNPARQPKQEIAEYVERNGILVPHRFANLDDALSSETPFIVRSEHKQDYNGVSDLLSSYRITQKRIRSARREYGSKPEEIDWSNPSFTYDLRPRFEAVGKTIAQLGKISQEKFEDNLKRLSRLEISKYSRLLGINAQQFSSEISYSYWELLGGHNRAIVADSAIPDRYHIFTTTPGSETKHGYVVVENGEVTTNISSKLPSGIYSDIQSLVNFYESIRNLPHFDKAHCPIVEAQTVGGSHYFLQYHKAADFNPSSFMLDRDREEDEIKAIFVRGATVSEGITVNVDINDSDRGMLNQEDGGLDLYVNHIFTELMLRRRKIHLFRRRDMKQIVRDANYNHFSKSQLFKTPVSIVLGSEGVKSLLNGVETSPINSVPQIQLRVVSDGRNAYVKKIT